MGHHQTTADPFPQPGLLDSCREHWIRQSVLCGPYLSLPSLLVSAGFYHHKGDTKVLHASAPEPVVLHGLLRELEQSLSEGSHLPLSVSSSASPQEWTLCSHQELGSLSPG
jgi:hypothetical protein